MFEPMGGSTPKYTGKNDQPSGGDWRRYDDVGHLGERKAAQRVENAMMQVLGKHIKSLGAGEMGYTTQEVGDLVVKYL